MLFGPGKTNNFEYSSNVYFQPPKQNNPKSTCVFNNSFTMGQKCSSQEKLSRNADQRFFNFQNPAYVTKTEPPMPYEDERFKQTVVFKSPTHNIQFSKSCFPRQNNLNMPLQQECLILRKQRSQLSQKMKRAQEELQTKQNMIKGKQRQIEQLKSITSQSNSTKSQTDIFSDLRSEKQKLYFQVIQLQTEIHKMQEKYEKMQRDHYGLVQKYDELTNKSTIELSRKVSKEELLQSELSLSEKRNQRIKAEYQKQIMNLKQKMKQMEGENSKFYNNKSTVISYNQSSFSDCYTPLKSQPDLDNSRLEVQKLQAEIKQKSQMIRYLQMQCLKDKRRQSENQNYKINSTHEQCKKELAKANKQGQMLKKQITGLQNKVSSSDKMRQELMKQVKDLEYLLKQVREKSCKMMEQNRTINKRERESNEKLNDKIHQLEAQLSRCSAKFRGQLQQNRKAYEKALSQIKEKSSNELIAKDQQMKQYSIEKQELLSKVTEYQKLLKQNFQNISQFEDLKLKMKQSEEEKTKLDFKVVNEFQQNLQRLQKQLKIKTQQLYSADLKIVGLQKQAVAAKKALQFRIKENTQLTNQMDEERTIFQTQKKKIDQELNKIKQQNQTLKSSVEEKQRSDLDRQKYYEIQIQSITSKSQKDIQKYENLLHYLREEQTKLRNMIAERQRDNLNLTISYENQKQKNAQSMEKIKLLKQEKKQLKKQSQSRKQKLLQLEKSLEGFKQENKVKNQTEEQVARIFEEQKQRLASAESMLVKQDSRIKELEAQVVHYEQNQRLCLLQIGSIKDIKREQRTKKQQQLTYLKQQISKMQECQNRNKLQLEQINRKLSNKIKQIQIKDKQIENLQQNVQTITNQFTLERINLNSKIEYLSTSIAQIKEEVLDRDNRIFQMESQLAEVTVRMENISMGNEKLVRQIEEQKQSTKVKQNIIYQLKQQLKKTQIQIQQKTSQINTDTPTIEQLSTQLSLQHQQIHKNQSLLTELQKKQKNNEQQIKYLQLTLAEKQLLLDETIKEYSTQLQQCKANQLEQTCTIQMLSSKLKKYEDIQNQCRKSLDQKDRYSREIQVELQELTRELQDIKEKFVEVEANRKVEVKVGQDPDQEKTKDEDGKGLKISKMSGLSSQSFIGDFIEIDKNALLHICDLLGLEPVQGCLLSSIIETIQNSNYLSINQYYRQILQLFGVDTEQPEKMQQKLIGQIKGFRETLLGLVDKVSILQNRNEGLSKQNNRICKQINKLEYKQIRGHKIQIILEGINEQIIKLRLQTLNNKYPDLETMQQN